MEWLKFWGQCIIWGFTQWERGQSMLNQLVPLILAVVSGTFLLLGIGGTYQSMQTNDLLWLLVWSPLSVLIVAVAPFRLWLDKTRELKKLTTRTLGIKSNVIYGQQDKTAIITVSNLALDGSQVTNCSGFLHGVYYRADGHLNRESKISSVYLQWSARHGGIGQKEMTFFAEADLNVAVIESNPTGSFLIVALEHQLRNQYWLNERREWIFDIEIAAQDSPRDRRYYSLRTHPLGMRSQQDDIGGYIRGPLPNWAFKEADEFVAAQMQSS